MPREENKLWRLAKGSETRYTTHENEKASLEMLGYTVLSTYQEIPTPPTHRVVLVKRHSDGTEVKVIFSPSFGYNIQGAPFTPRADLVTFLYSHNLTPTVQEYGELLALAKRPYV